MTFLRNPRWIVYAQVLNEFMLGGGLEFDDPEQWAEAGQVCTTCMRQILSHPTTALIWSKCVGLQRRRVLPSALRMTLSMDDLLVDTLVYRAQLA